MITAALTREQELEQSRFIAKVYAWMGGALGVTALVSLWAVNTPALMQFIFGSRFVFLGLILFELVCVGVLAGAVNKLSLQVASAIFVGYAVLNGLTLSSIFLIYTSSSIASTFFAAAAMFGIMSTYGYFTQRDLTSVGNLCFMGLVGIVIASLINLFLQNETISWVTSVIGVIVFTGLIAWDTQKIKNVYATGALQGDNVTKGAILGALSLYLDFINLFLMLLRLFGRRK
jgi:FtsH-binding integral membrane protein